MAHSTFDSSTRSTGPQRWTGRPQVPRGLVTAMLEFALATAAAGAEKQRHLPIPPWGFSLIALGLFFTLFAITWAFRSVGNRH